MAIHIAVFVAAIALNLLGMVAVLAVGAAIGKSGTADKMTQSEKDNTKVVFIGGAVCIGVGYMLMALIVLDLAGV